MDIVGQELQSVGQLGLLANILRRAQDEIAPVDKDTVDEFKELQAILEDYDIPEPEEDLEEEKKPKRRRRSTKKEKPEKAPFEIAPPRRFDGGPVTDAHEFAEVLGDYLISSETVLNKFQHNDEKDEKDYEKEEEKKQEKATKK